ncbi:hypothetical protein [Flavobacterium sp.]|uniref:hypothetical protein n=1 Tax=Flavobacterium sp. TaxID=239 RepID=UPI00391B1DF9
MFIISFFSVWFANVLYSPTHKYLRDNKVHFILVAISIIMLIASVLQIKPDWEKFQKVNALGPILLICYLALYKLFDFIALKKYNRHMYFSCRISNWMEKEEAKEATWLEFVMQFSLLMISMFLWWKLGDWIAENYL